MQTWVLGLALAVVATATWVAADARRVEPEGVGLGPLRWFVLCLVVWPVTVPSYVVHRRSMRALSDRALADFTTRLDRWDAVVQGTDRPDRDR